jgi:glycosyltransferase involved in cell wall biosynthesis
VEDSIESLYAALIRLLKDQNLREMLAANFYQKVIEQHTWIKVSETIIKEML